jgi:hypothetical protein
MKKADTLKNLEMAKKRNHKIMITDETIKKCQGLSKGKLNQRSMIFFGNWRRKFCAF